MFVNNLSATGVLCAVLLNRCTKSRFHPNRFRFFNFPNCCCLIRTLDTNPLFAFVLVSSVFILRILELEQELAAHLAVKERISKELNAAKQEHTTVHICADTLEKKLAISNAQVSELGQKLQMTQKKHDESMADLRAKLDEKDHESEMLLKDCQVS